ncbi:hypothetical protein [Geomonas azotofigens]|uniref:hypothetical protein n=1 Tax=Geomonas azotofigens TaxID=2843196 RepID=UPI001C11A758|nr:hypothetical protein [Geomonas azotofigens]MBU5614570.1 hypothetical protein [Geomonas azotofigens]
MKTMKMLTTATALTILAACAGCSLIPGKAAKPAPSPYQGVTMLSGKVVETFDGGGYTYVNLLKDGKNTWIAAPVMKVTVGQDLELLPGATMPNFTSKSLGRTFDNIVFSGGLASQLNAPAAGAAGAPATAKADDGLPEADDAILVGTVIETITASNYIYLRLEKDGKASWAAVPRTDVAVGDEVELAPGTPMGQFSSKTLNRTFKSIYFAGGVTVTKAKAPAPAAAAPGASAPAAAAENSPLPSNHPKIDQAEINKAMEKAMAVAAAAPITGKVVETADAGGYTYLCVEKDGVKTWVAVPTMSAKVGDEVSLNAGNVMTNFPSKTLNRTFEKIIFSSGPTAK